MKALSLSILALALSACSLTPKQLQALDGAVCNKAKFAGSEWTTTAVGGSSKNAGTVINGENCSIATQGKP